VTHAAVVGDKGAVRSKWGANEVHEHAVWDVPTSYGDVVRYFRRPAPETVLRRFAPDRFKDCPLRSESDSIAASQRNVAMCQEATYAVQRNDARRRAVDGPRARCMFHCGHAPAAPLGMVLCIGGCSPARALVSLTATRQLVRT
jgi:hypothetical protein